MVCNADVNSTVMFQFYLIVSWMSTVWWSLPSLHGSILPQGCQQYGDMIYHHNDCQQYSAVYHNSVVQLYPMDVNKTVIFTMTWMSTTWWYLPRQESQQHCYIYHHMDLNNAVIFTMIWCQQCCDIHHDMDVNSTVVFTMMKMSTVLWYLNYMDVNSTVVFTVI